MKNCSLKTLAFGLAMAVMASSTGVLADHSGRDFFDSSNSSSSDDKRCISQRKIENLTDRARRDLEIIFASLNNIYTFLGASSNPNPLTNPAVAGIIIANDEKIAVVAFDFLKVLKQLGVPQDAIRIIRDQMRAFLITAERYAIDVNLANTGQPSGDQIADAINFLNAAAALGQSFLALTHDPQFTGILTEIANLTTQDVQAYRGVLADDNAFDAIPSDPTSEAIAAVVINVIIQQLAAQLADNLIPELAEDKCSGDF